MNFFFFRYMNFINKHVGKIHKIAKNKNPKEKNAASFTWLTLMNICVDITETMTLTHPATPIEGLTIDFFLFGFKLNLLMVAKNIK